MITGVMKPLMIGEAPSKSGDRYWQFPLSGGPAKSVCGWMGWPPDGPLPGGWYWALRERFDCINLLERYPGAQGRGAAFPLAAARDAWADLWPTLSGRVVVLLGRRLATVTGTWTQEEEATFHGWWHVHAWDGVHLSSPAQIVSIPHPSGLNRMYGEPGQRERSAVTLREAIERAETTHAEEAEDHDGRVTSGLPL